MPFSNHILNEIKKNFFKNETQCKDTLLLFLSRFVSYSWTFLSDFSTWLFKRTLIYICHMGGASQIKSMSSFLNISNYFLSAAWSNQSVCDITLAFAALAFCVVAQPSLKDNKNKPINSLVHENIMSNSVCQLVEICATVNPEVQPMGCRRKLIHQENRLRTSKTYSV